MEKLSESQLQSRCVKWFRATFTDRIIYSIPNGGYGLAPRTAAKLKREGLLSGIPDLCIPHSRKGYKGFYIEMKVPGGRLSKEQEAIHKILKAESYLMEVHKSIESFQSSVGKYLGDSLQYSFDNSY